MIKENFSLSGTKKNLLDERTASIQHDNHYVYHTGWAIRKLMQTRPEKHIDISSLLYFVTMG
jgi:hypothetical protein